jgi:hypothetical protein
MCSAVISKLSVLCEALSDHRAPLAINHCHWVFDNIKKDVIFEENHDSFQGIASVKSFTLGYKSDTQFGPTLKAPCTIIIATSWIFLCEERFETYVEDNKVSKNLFYSFYFIYFILFSCIYSLNRTRLRCPSLSSLTQGHYLRLSHWKCSRTPSGSD